MSHLREDGVTPKTRPVPQDIHIDHFEAQDKHDSAVRIVMAKDGIGWPDALKKVDAVGYENILAEHNKPAETLGTPSAEDLDSVAAEQKTAEQTAEKPKSWGKTATSKK